MAEVQSSFWHLFLLDLAFAINKMGIPTHTKSSSNNPPQKPADIQLVLFYISFDFYLFYLVLKLAATQSRFYVQDLFVHLFDSRAVIPFPETFESAIEVTVYVSMKIPILDVTFILYRSILSFNSIKQQAWRFTNPSLQQVRTKLSHHANTYICK